MSQCRLSFAQILRTTLFTLLLLGMLASRAQAQDYILQGVSATQASYNAGGNAVVEVTIQNLSPATPPSIDLAINPTNTPAIAANWGFTSATGGGSCTPSFTTPYFPNSTDFQCNLPQGATGVFTFTATSLATPAASPETYNQEIQLFGSCGSVDCGPLAVNFDVLTAVTAPPVVGLSSIRQFREDSGTRVLVFSRSGDASAPLSFQLNSDNSTAPGRATPGDDFSPISTSISWAALDSSDKTLVLPILDDDIYEGDERFRIIASNLSDNSASFSFSPAIDITILDNEIEPAGEFNFSSANYRVNENGGNITISVERSGGGNGPVAVDYASADDSAVDGEDYSSASGSLSWADGEQGIKTFSLAIHSDILNEANESFSLQLSKPSGNALLGQLNQASVTIINVNDAGAPQVVGATINAIDYDGDGQVVVPLNADGKVEAESAIASISWSLGGSEIASGLNTSASFSLGEHTVRLTATDSNGKQAAVNYLVKVSSLEAGSTIRLSDTPGLSPTQGSVAQSLDSLCPRLAELSQVGGLSQGQANLRERCDKLRQPGLGSEDIVSALDQIGGEEVEALVATAARFSHVHLGNLRNRFTKLRSGRRKLIDVSGFNLQFEGGSLSGQVFADAGRKALGGAASADEQPEILRDSKLGLFINGNIAYKEKDSEAERAGFELDIQGITAGVDYRFNPNLIGGLALGYANSQLDYQRQSGNMDSRSTFYSVYVSYYNDSNFYLDSSLSYADADFDLLRRIRYRDSGGEVAADKRSNTEGEQWLATVDLGWDFNSGPWTFGPNASLSYSETNIDSFAERGHSGLELHYGEQHNTLASAGLGFHGSRVLLFNWGVLVANINGNFYREFDEQQDPILARFVHDPFYQKGFNGGAATPAMLISPSRYDRNYFNLGLGLVAQFHYGMSGFIDYQQMLLGDGLRSRELAFGLRYETRF